MSSYLHTACRGTQPALFVALIALRNQLTLKASEGLTQPQDERLALARSWLEAFPGAQSVFSVWERTTEVFLRLLCACFLRLKNL